MPISTSDGQVFEDAIDYQFNRPMDLTKEPGYNPETDTYQAPTLNRDDAFEAAAESLREKAKPGVSSQLSYTERTGKDISNYPGMRKSGEFTRMGEKAAVMAVAPAFDWTQRLLNSGIDFIDLIDQYHQGKDLTDPENIKRAFNSLSGLGGPVQSRSTIPGLVNRFIFGRHGETDANESDKVRGQGPTPLNEDGLANAETLAKSISGSRLPAKHIVASPVERAKQTADIVGDKLGLPVETHPGLSPWDVGVAEGQKDTGQLDKYCIGNLQDTPPPGSSESINQFKQRVMSAIGDITDKYPEGAVIIGHNSTERAMAEHLNGENYKDDGIEPGTHKEFKIAHDDVFSQAFQNAAQQYKEGNAEEGGKQAARFGRAALTSLLGKVAGTVTGPIEAAKRIIERYEQATEALTQGKPAPEVNPAEHVTDLFQVLGALGGGLGSAPENAAAANSIKIVPRAPAFDTIGRTTKDFIILRNTPEGEIVSGDTHGTYHPDTGHLHVGWLGTGDESPLATGSAALKTNAHAHAYKMSEIRDLIREAIKEFPDVKTIGGGHTSQQPGGGRVSGAHSVSNTPQYFTVTDKMRQEVLGKKPDLSGPLERSLGQLAQKTERKGYVPAGDPYTQQAYEPEPGAFNRPQPARTLEEGVQRFQDQFQSTMEDIRNWDVTNEEIARGALSPTSADEIEAMARRWEEFVNEPHDELNQIPFAGHLLPRQAADVYNSLGVFAGDSFRHAYRREATRENVEDFEDILHIESQPGGPIYSKGSKESSIIAGLKKGQLPSDEELIKDFESGARNNTLATKYGVSSDRIAGNRARLGFPSYLKNILRSDSSKESSVIAGLKDRYDHQYIRNAIKMGAGLKELAEHYNVSKSAISQYLKSMGIKNTNPRRPGPKMKVTDQGRWEGSEQFYETGESPLGSSPRYLEQKNRRLR